MSILIKGMEMPKGNHEIIVRIQSDGRVLDQWGHRFNQEFIAVPVPPHGRLGDLDALITTFCEWGTRLERKGTLVITMAEAKQTIVDIIEKATTIIPPEPPKEEANGS